MEILERIEEIYTQLTKKQRIIADYMKNHVEEMSFITLKELSSEAGTTELTVLNMCKALGYESFNEVKYEFRKYIGRSRMEFYRANEYYNTALPEYELSEKERLLMEICQEEKGLIEEMTRKFDSRKMLQIAEKFENHRRIVLCGRGISYLLCCGLKCALPESGIYADCVNTELNDEVYRALPILGKDTLLVAAYFPDYYFMTQKLAEYAKKQGAEIIALTDCMENNLVPLADEVLLAPSTTRLSLNTLSTPMAVVNLLSSAVRIVCGNKEFEDSFSKMF